jgi:hypothetical protein
MVSQSPELHILAESNVITSGAIGVIEKAGGDTFTEKSMFEEETFRHFSLKCSINFGTLQTANTPETFSRSELLAMLDEVKKILEKPSLTITQGKGVATVKVNPSGNCLTERSQNSSIVVIAGSPAELFALLVNAVKLIRRRGNVEAANHKIPNTAVKGIGFEGLVGSLGLRVLEDRVAVDFGKKTVVNRHKLLEVTDKFEGKHLTVAQNSTIIHAGIWDGSEGLKGGINELVNLGRIKVCEVDFMINGRNSIVLDSFANTWPCLIEIPWGRGDMDRIACVGSGNIVRPILGSVQKSLKIHRHGESFKTTTKGKTTTRMSL